MRKEFQLSPDELSGLLKACESVPLIMLQCGMPRSPQERANDAWQALGNKLGFVWDTVEPIPSKGQEFFTAECVAEESGVAA